MRCKRLWTVSQERGFVAMAPDLFTALVDMGVQVTLVLGVILFLVSVGRDCRRAFSGPK